MINEEYVSLAALGYKDNYIITKSGKVYNIETNKEATRKRNQVYIKKQDSSCGEYVNIFYLYKKAFHKPLYIDNVVDLQGEEWKAIKGTHRKYYISNKGRIKSYKNNIVQLLYGWQNDKGYYYISINGTKKPIHVLVAEAFVLQGKPIDKEKKVVHHKDLNVCNNAAVNLQWMTYAEHKRLHIELKEKQKGGKDNE